ncbi:MAG: FCD domain-containing protein [Pseudomonadota bacterium]
MALRKRFEEIAEHLELLIISGELKEGDRIPSERALMEKFSAGRPSVREAIFSLQKKGLLSDLPRGVPRVQSPRADIVLKSIGSSVRQYIQRPEGIRNLQQARSLLESGLARSAARSATPADLRVLEKALRKNERARNQADFVASDLEFHQAIAAIASNEIFTSLNRSLAEWLRQQRTASADAGATMEEVARQHRDIYEAIAARDEEGACIAMESHLAFVARLFWMGQNPPDPD